MRVHERHSLWVVPFVVAGVAVRRGLETLRLIYWRRVFGWQIAASARVHLTVHIPKELDVSLGDGVELSKHVEIWSEVCRAKLTIGRGSVISRGTVLDVSGGLTIGANVTVSEEAVVYTHSHGRDPKSAPRYYPLAIGDRAWICSRAMILASARSIGENAIVGPYEVVREPVLPGQMIASRTGADTHA